MNQIPFTEELLVAIREAIANNNPERIPYPYEIQPAPDTISIVLSLKAAQALKGLTQNPLETTWMCLTVGDRIEIFSACIAAGIER